MLTTLALVLLAVCSTALADITGSNPRSGTCLCIDGSDVDIRSTPCRRVIGTVSTGSCFLSKGRKQNCRLGSRNLDFFLFDYNGRDGWTAGTLLNTADASRCGSSRGRTGATTALTRGEFTTNCMKCICEVEGCDRIIGKCNLDTGTLSCGPFQIKSPYFTDCKRRAGITESWQECTKQKACSERCVTAYMARYGTPERCLNRPMTCREFARLHNGGPDGCKTNPDAVVEQNLKWYWGNVTICCNRIGGC